MLMEPPRDTVPSWIHWKSCTSPNEEAVVSYSPCLKRSSLTYYEIHNLASRFAHILKEGGVRKGDMVVNALPNCLEHIVTSLGTLMAGGVNIAVEIFMNSGETFYEVLDKTKTKMLIVQKGDEITSWNLVKDHLDLSSFTHGGLTTFNKSAKSFKLEHAFVVSREGTPFLEYLRTMNETYSCPSVTPEDPCLAFSTSSSTSLVRLVLHTHKSLIRSGKASKVILHGEKDYLNNTPPTWATNFPGDFLVWGVTRVSLDQWAPPPKNIHEDKLLADVIEKEKIDMVFMIPPLAEAVMKHWHPRPLKMVKHLIIGAMPVREKAVQKLMPAANRITVRYMSSESPGITYNTFKSADHFHDFDSGVPESDLQIRCVNESLKDVGPKQTDDMNFQNICACVVQKVGCNLTASDIKDHYRSNYVDEEKDSFCPNDVLFFDKLPERAPGQVDRKRATELATQLIQSAQQKGITGDKLKTFTLS